MRWWVVAMGGCAAPSWELVADDIEGGMMLGAVTLGDEVVIAGGDEDGSLWRYDGDTLCVEAGVTEGAPLWWAHGRTASDWYAVGEQGAVVHEVDGERTREDLPTEGTLFGVYDDGTHVWAVSGNVTAKPPTGAVWRKESGGAWVELASTPDVAFKVHEGWVVGVGFAWEWDGTAFVDRTPPGAPRLLTVRVRGPNDVWAVGGTVSPVFLHWNGSEWEEPELDPNCVSQPLNGVYTEADDDVWLAGFRGNAASTDGTSWTCEDFPITDRDFHAVWRFGDEVLALGGTFFAAPPDRVGTLSRYGQGALATFEGACP